MLSFDPLEIVHMSDSLERVCEAGSANAQTWGQMWGVLPVCVKGGLLFGWFAGNFMVLIILLMGSVGILIMAAGRLMSLFRLVRQRRYQVNECACTRSELQNYAQNEKNCGQAKGCRQSPTLAIRLVSMWPGKKNNLTKGAQVTDQAKISARKDRDKGRF